MSSWSESLVTIPPGRHTLPRDFVSAHQRERIFLATAELVAKRGYNGTSIDLITKTARVALSTFYENFETKHECFLAAFDAAIAEGEQILTEAIDPTRPWPDQIAAGLEAFLNLVIASPAKARMCLVEAQGAGPVLLDRYEAVLEALAPKLREGRKLVTERKLPERSEEAVLGGLAWVLHQRIVTGEFDQIMVLFPEMLQIALRPYLGPVEAERWFSGSQSAASMAGVLRSGTPIKRGDPPDREIAGGSPGDSSVWSHPRAITTRI
jgi:AcrR family transcriptional regulator